MMGSLAYPVFTATDRRLLVVIIVVLNSLDFFKPIFSQRGDHIVVPSAPPRCDYYYSNRHVLWVSVVGLRRIPPLRLLPTDP